MNSKKIVSMIAAAVVAASMALSSLSVCAAVTTMPDGGKFDAAYYAATYPDVVAALGIDANALYQHYKTCGAKEGRLPYAAGTTATTTTTQSTQMPAAVRKAAQTILRKYLSTGSSSWKNLRDYRMGWDVTDPCFAVADLNGDGVYELYISYLVSEDGLNAWDLYTIDSNGKASYITLVSGYNSALGAYDYDIGCGYVIGTLTGTKITWMLSYQTSDYADYDPTSGPQYWNVYNYDSAGTPANVGKISEANGQAIMAAYLPINSLTTMSPLTRANVNAIK